MKNNYFATVYICTENSEARKIIESIQSGILSKPMGGHHYQLRYSKRKLTQNFKRIVVKNVGSIEQVIFISRGPGIFTDHIVCLASCTAHSSHRDNLVMDSEDSSSDQIIAHEL